MYGKEFRALADDLGISAKEAKELLALWRKTFPKVAAYLTASGEYAKMHLCARTLGGRRRLFHRPDWDTARKVAQERAVEEDKNPLSVTSDGISRVLKGMYDRIDRQGKNTPIQGTNVDIAKVAMALAWTDLETKYNAGYVLMVHDELVIEAPEEVAQKVYDFLMECIREAGRRFLKRVVMESDGCVSDCWQKG